MQFDPEVVREIMWQGMTKEEYRNTQEPIDYEAVDHEAGREIAWQGITEEEYRNDQELIDHEAGIGIMW